MGWEKVLLPRATALLDVLEGVDGAQVPEYAPGLAWGPEGARKSSPNHEALAWGLEAARAAVDVGRVDRYPAARRVLLDTYHARERATLWTSEQFCGDPHGGYHLAGPTLGLLAAVLAADSELELAMSWLISLTAGAFLAVANPAREIWAPGMRPPRKGPVASVASEWLRCLLGERQGNALTGPNAAANWRHGLYIAVRAMRWLDLLPEAKQQPNSFRRPGVIESLRFAIPSPCTLRLPMVVYRWETGHQASIDRPSRPLPHQERVVSWVRCEYSPRVRAKSRVTFALNWGEAPPAVPAGAKQIVFPGVR